MNKIYFPILLGCALPASLLAQSGPPPVPQNTNSPVALAPATIFQRSANERVWVRIANVTNFDGSVSLVTNRAYVELATGIGKFSSDSNAWVDADPTINIVANGAAATGTRHSVTFAGNAAAAGGAVTLTTPDAKTFVSSVYGLDYYDSAMGSNVMLGTLQNCQGVVVGDHEVIYSNAFSGSVTADLEYFNKLSDF
jgi:hypothetical protein